MCVGGRCCWHSTAIYNPSCPPPPLSAERVSCKPGPSELGLLTPHSSLPHSLPLCITPSPLVSKSRLLASHPCPSLSPSLFASGPVRSE